MSSKTGVIFLIFSFLLVFRPEVGFSQCTPGTITNGHSSTRFDALFDPDGDGFITESGSSFTSGTTELAEFEILANSTTGWIALVDGGEVAGDVNPNCGNSDLIQDDNGSDFGFFNIIDPSPLSPVSGDEMILFRFRLAQSPNGNFGYNFLVDTDGSYGLANDTNAVCGNNGFEREVQFANAGGNKGVSVFDIDGSTSINSTLCDQCISVNDIQEACSASSASCGTSDPQFITFPIPLSHLGIPSDIDLATFFIVSATANSGNATSVLGGGNVSDLGALDGGNSPCSCIGLTDCALFDCQTDCINSAFLKALPVELLSFEAQAQFRSARIQWTTASEANLDYFEIQFSYDGRVFSPLGKVNAVGDFYSETNYEFFHKEVEVTHVYYRLKTVELSGSVEHSSIKEVKFEADMPFDFQCRPSVVNWETTLHFDGAPRGVRNLRIFDSYGRLVNQISLDKTTNNYLLDCTSLPPGPYFVQLIIHDIQFVNSFLKH
ncbi:MAG: hypothetical protein HKN16_08880 [Saprospiraceae bacterium]|nr:hypothetical protein [Saprospiraceae bacterium]